MIGKLRGIVDSAGEDHVLLDVNGVFYLVYAPARTLRLLPAAGGEASLLIETHVREDHIHLYGFAEESERAWFRLLQTVQGVGTRLALAILSALPPDALGSAVAAHDKAVFRQVSGVGPKLAERIITELKGKSLVMDSAGPRIVAAGKSSAPAAGGAVADAVSALAHLGYSRSDAFAAVNKAARSDEAATVETLVRGALKELAA